MNLCRVTTFVTPAPTKSDIISKEMKEELTALVWNSAYSVHPDEAIADMIQDVHLVLKPGTLLAYRVDNEVTTAHINWDNVDVKSCKQKKAKGYMCISKDTTPLKLCSASYVKSAVQEMIRAVRGLPGGTSLGYYDAVVDKTIASKFTPLVDGNNNLYKTPGASGESQVNFVGVHEGCWTLIAVQEGLLEANFDITELTTIKPPEPKKPPEAKLRP